PASPAAPVLQVSVTPSCNNPDGTVMVVRPRGTDYQYSMDGGTYQGSAIFAALRWGEHTVRVRNVKTGCVSEEGKITVPAIPPPPVLSAYTEDTKCVGGLGVIHFDVSGANNGSYTIKHKDGEFRDVKVVNGKASVSAPAGIYNNLVLYDPASGCDSNNPQNVVNATVIQAPAITITVDSIREVDLKSQNQGAIYLHVVGGTGPGTYSYKWNNGQTTEDIKDLSNGTYMVTVTDANNCDQSLKIIVPEPNLPPVAVNDSLISNCVFQGNVITNDTDPENDALFIDVNPVAHPLHGTVILNKDGSFVYHPYPAFAGIDSFKYALLDKNRYADITATVYLTVIADFDHDGIPDDVDLDVDGDGIINEREVMAGQDWHTEDTDKDGLPNYKDIDADGDGIVDNYEAQLSGKTYRPPVIYDANNNGLNDAYDGRQSGYEIIPIDTDGDGIPDFLDPDSDKDGVPDRIEGHDMDSNGKADHVKLGKDTDSDGLDDGYDTVVNDCDALDNMTGSNASMQDFDGDGIPDWRDDNDDNDNFLTYYEDMNGDGDFSNDDFDYDGYPEYLDYGRECDLFIPDAFSPNGDGVHDYYQIYCINHYPNAKIYIFDQLGNKLYEKANYGNEDIWGRDGAAWWDGTPDRGRNRGEKVAPGTYYYVLDLGNGEVKKSFVFVSY
ncbi:MAG: gliding motility-associated C-terminal domain-containing protein, partial [Candidatus Saccharibacteria bacterium]